MNLVSDKKIANFYHHKQASALRSLIAACPAWKKREKRRSTQTFHTTTGT